jgi:membrane protein insertase Oxa1/YidC/SpoIIIJ
MKVLGISIIGMTYMVILVILPLSETNLIEIERLKKVSH